MWTKKMTWKQGYFSVNFRGLDCKTVIALPALK